ncbi:hypothetical protein LZ30DRAFT_692529 [Colletotrichum cereale]|nr:hypothetical protein LZ30DRAFT_692529 [Colletotrichum cereale]
MTAYVQHGGIGPATAFGLPLPTSSTGRGYSLCWRQPDMSLLWLRPLCVILLAGYPPFPVHRIKFLVPQLNAMQADVDQHVGPDEGSVENAEACLVKPAPLPVFGTDNFQIGRSCCIRGAQKYTDGHGAFRWPPNHLIILGSQLGACLHSPSSIEREVRAAQTECLNENSTGKPGCMELQPPKTLPDRYWVNVQ